MRHFLIIMLIFLPHLLCAQVQRGFDREEYLEVLRMTSRQGDSTFFKKVEAPKVWKRLYRSPVVGLDNRWDLWQHRHDGVVSINFRGTTSAGASWLANFYSGMIPAKGQVTIAEGVTQEYHLADHPQACVHAGWTLGMAHLLPTVLQQIDSCYKAGVRDFLITGHSQGGALAILMTAQLRKMKENGKLPSDIRIKTYASAAPKPGNLYFAYDYEASNFGWAFTVVNSADWVPETPITVQTIDDFNEINPFKNVDPMLAKQKWTTRLFVKKAYNDMNEPTIEARRAFKKYLGNTAGDFVLKTLPYHRIPELKDCFHYVRCGIPVVLYARGDYYKEFPDDPNKVFIHHMMEPYIYLTNAMKEN